MQAANDTEMGPADDQQQTTAAGSSRQALMAPDLLTLLYAAFVAIGGIIGYVKAGSVPSLAAGLLCGILMMFGSIQMGQDETNVTLSLVTSATLTAVMGYRFNKSGKFIPAGLVAAFSLLMVIRFGYTALKST